MEEIKSSFEKIFDQFSNESIIPHNIPKRLSFDSLNDSIDSSKRVFSVTQKNVRLNIFQFFFLASKKRKSSLEMNTPNEKKPKHDLNNSSITASPWEARRMKADLIEAKSQVKPTKIHSFDQNVSNPLIFFLDHPIKARNQTSKYT